MSTKLSCGIVGLPNVGKSTLFQALTRKQVSNENYPFCTIDPNMGIVEMIDSRLKNLAVLSNSEKIVYAAICFVDIAGLVKGASKGEGLGNQFLSNIRETDAIIHVVRAFEDEEIIHVHGAVDPVEDIKTINLELILADLSLAQNIKNKFEKQAKAKKEHKGLSLMEKVVHHLNEEKPLRTLSLTKEEKEELKPYPFLTEKKVIYVANVKEEDLFKDNRFVERIKEFAKTENSPVIKISAKLEQEIAELPAEEVEEYLKTLGIEKSGLDQLIASAFKMLDLITFFTTGEMETKAWTIKKNTTAEEAAAKIHTDIKKGFIKAEIVSYDDFIHCGGRVKAKEEGKVRFEGRDAVIHDGDVILFHHH